MDCTLSIMSFSYWQRLKTEVSLVSLSMDCTLSIMSFSYWQRLKTEVSLMSGEDIDHLSICIYHFHLQLEEKHRKFPNLPFAIKPLQTFRSYYPCSDALPLAFILLGIGIYLFLNEILYASPAIITIISSHQCAI